MLFNGIDRAVGEFFLRKISGFCPRTARVENEGLNSLDNFSQTFASQSSNAPSVAGLSLSPFISDTRDDPSSISSFCCLDGRLTARRVSKKRHPKSQFWNGIVKTSLATLQIMEDGSSPYSPFLRMK